MSIELEYYLLNSGTALVLHGERELIDADLAQLRELPRKQRAAITSVVLSNTDITGEGFRHLAYLPNLKALYVSNTRVNDDAPLERLPKSLEIINLDHTEVGDLCAFKLRMVPNLHSVHLRKTGITDRGVNILATLSNLRECHVDGMAISEHSRQRLSNAIDLSAVTFSVAMCSLLYGIQLEARKFMLRARNIRPVRYFS